MPSFAARALIITLALVLAGCTVTRVDRVSTRDQRITDPDYTGFYRVMGEKFLQDRRYTEAWTEFAALTADDSGRYESDSGRYESDSSRGVALGCWGEAAAGRVPGGR